MPTVGRGLCQALVFILLAACAADERTGAGASSKRPRARRDVAADRAEPPKDAGRVQSSERQDRAEPEAPAMSSAGAAAAEPVDAGHTARNGSRDAAAPEAMAPIDDAGTDQPGACAEFVMPPDCAPSSEVLPSDLRCTGLYGDFAERRVACGLTEYSPAFELWSDGAVKRRWVYLPAGSHVDTRDPDAFVYPVGTQFWKEFQVMLNGRLQRAETRLLRKIARGWLFTTYVWTTDGREAKRVDDGVADWAGTGHSVPTRDHCLECHDGRADQILGWDPVLLGEGARGVHFADVQDDDAGVAVSALPGDAVERAALGYLHVNCGVSCHNPTLPARARDTGMYLRLWTGRGDGVLETPAVASTINQLSVGHAPVFELPEPAAGPYYDLLPGSPERSLLLARMLVRNHAAQMPPIASNRVDEHGVALIKAFIEHMTPERGYPAPLE